MRAAPLTVIKEGINRLRLKGGARADSLYDLLNGYVTDSDTAKVRPGTLRDATLDELTRGLVAFDGVLHTFCHIFVDVPAGYELSVLVHPDATEYDEIALEKIHFAEPFMGALYVVAEFDGGDIFHYWLQVADEWQYDTVYTHGALVRPSDWNGLVFQASRLGDPYPAWAPNVPRSDGSVYGYEASIIEPTVFNNFYYTCVLTGGTNPRSGEIEPEWPTEEGAQVVEYADGEAEEALPAPPEPPSNNTPSEPYRERYGRGELER
jgi:hypothetical protein